MILNLEFNNFRSFKNTCSFTTEPNASKAKTDNIYEIPVLVGENKKALKISFIYGANASGKTNIIKFLYGFRRWVLNLDNRVGEDIALYHPFKFDPDYANAPTGFSIEFITEKIRYCYEISFGRKHILNETLIYYPKGKQTILYKRVCGGDESHFDTISFGSSLTSNKTFNVFQNQLLLSKFLMDTPSEEITPAAQYFSNMIVSNGFHEDTMLEDDKDKIRWLYSSPKNQERLSEFLAFADTGLVDLNLQKMTDNIEVSGLHKTFREGENIGKENLPLKEESFGTRALFMIGCDILKALESGSPFIIDEMDSGLHSYITELIVKIFRNDRINKNHSQLIFTTHDVNLLDQNTVRRDQIWFTEKNSRGESEIYSLSDFEDVREDTAFDKWYMNNKFGGVPTLKSLENLFVSENNE